MPAGDTGGRLTASVPSFGPLTSADEVARLIGAAQLAALRACEPGTRAGLEPEHLHKMRVATRRLRAALRAFAECFAPRPRQALRRELRGWRPRWGRSATSTLAPRSARAARLAGRPARGRLDEAGGAAPVATGKSPPGARGGARCASLRTPARACGCGSSTARPGGGRITAATCPSSSWPPRRSNAGPASSARRSRPAAASRAAGRSIGSASEASSFATACEFFGPLYGGEFDEQVQQAGRGSRTRWAASRTGWCWAGSPRSCATRRWPGPGPARPSTSTCSAC